MPTHPGESAIPTISGKSLGVCELGMDGPQAAHEEAERKALERAFAAAAAEKNKHDGASPCGLGWAITLRTIGRHASKIVTGGKLGPHDVGGMWDKAEVIVQWDLDLACRRPTPDIPHSVLAALDGGSMPADATAELALAWAARAAKTTPEAFCETCEQLPLSRAGEHALGAAAARRALPPSALALLFGDPDNKGRAKASAKAAQDAANRAAAASASAATAARDADAAAEDAKTTALSAVVLALNGRIGWSVAGAAVAAAQEAADCARRAHEAADAAGAAADRAKAHAGGAADAAREGDPVLAGDYRKEADSDEKEAETDRSAAAKDYLESRRKAQAAAGAVDDAVAPK